MVLRAPLAPDSTLNNFSAQPFPAFGVPTSYLTANGATLETMLAATTVSGSSSRAC